MKCQFDDSVEMDLSHMRCDLAGLSAEDAAKKFYAWLCEVAKAVGAADPRIHKPGTREQAGDCWWVVWEDCPWPEWAMTGGGDCSGSNIGWESLLCGVHFSHPERGPMFRQGSQERLEYDRERLENLNAEVPIDRPKKNSWYMESYYGFDAIFQRSEVTAPCDQCGSKILFADFDALQIAANGLNVHDAKYHCDLCNEKSLQR